MICVFEDLGVFEISTFNSFFGVDFLEYGENLGLLEGELMAADFSKCLRGEVLLEGVLLGVTGKADRFGEGLPKYRVGLGGVAQLNTEDSCPASSNLYHDTMKKFE